MSCLAPGAYPSAIDPHSSSSFHMQVPKNRPATLFPSHKAVGSMRQAVAGVLALCLALQLAHLADAQSGELHMNI